MGCLEYGGMKCREEEVRFIVAEESLSTQLLGILLTR